MRTRGGQGDGGIGGLGDWGTGGQGDLETWRGGELGTGGQNIFVLVEMLRLCREYLRVAT